MGVVPLCVHSIAYNLVPVMYMIPLGLGIGLAVRMGNVLADSVSHAKKLAASYVALTAVIALIAGSLLYIFQAKIVALFSTDEQVVAGCREIWNHLCIYIINFFIFGINSGIMRALGMQLAMAAIICGTLWLACLPTLLYVAIWQDGGVTAVWYHLPYFYFAMNVLMVFWYMKADWHGISATIRERRDSSVEIKIEQNERTVLIDALNGNP
jgi:Na+-driven multidrug efflux pump